MNRDRLIFLLNEWVVQKLFRIWNYGVDAKKQQLLLIQLLMQQLV